MRDGNNHLTVSGDTRHSTKYSNLTFQLASSKVDENESPKDRLRTWDVIKGQVILCSRAILSRHLDICHCVLILKRQIITLELRHIERNVSSSWSTVQLAKTKVITHLLTYETAFSGRNFHVTQRKALEIPNYNKKNPVELKHCETSSSCKVFLSDKTKTSEGKVIMITSHEYRPFPSSLVPLFQNESKCETFHMKMSSACSFIFMQIKVNFIRMVLHLDSLWNRGRRELGNGLLRCRYLLLSRNFWSR